MMSCNDDKKRRVSSPGSVFAARMRRSVHVEIEQKLESTATAAQVSDAVKEIIEGGDNLLTLLSDHPALKPHVNKIRFGDETGDAVTTAPTASASSTASSSTANEGKKANLGWNYYVYKMDKSGGQLEDIEENSEDSVHAAKNWILPSADFDGLWESLVFEPGLKESLLSYVNTTMLFSKKKVDPNLVSWNRVVLFHGPPGTGKTSLCKALAHKLSIRLCDSYRYAHLVEINSHSLFSKWFSESGKLVQKMFETIEGLVEDPKVLVCVLVDEVESLAAARSRSGNEPSDAIRVVNAVLTQLDNIRRLPNVLILTTSNITGMIDVAFVDRADLKKYIGLPCEEAAYNMLKGSIGELADKNVIQSPVTIYEYAYSSNKSDKFSHAPTDALLAVVAKCTGLSGRMLRKLPFLAIVKIRAGEEEIATLQQFLEALHAVVDEELEDRKKLI